MENEIKEILAEMEIIPPEKTAQYEPTRPRRRRSKRYKEKREKKDKELINRQLEYAMKNETKKMMQMGKTLYFPFDIQHTELTAGFYKITHSDQYGYGLAPSSDEEDTYEPETPEDSITKDLAKDGYFPIEKYHTEIESMEEDVQNFLGSKDTYHKHGIAHKRGWLVYGDTGTGKTQYVAKLCERMVEDHGAIIIECTDPNSVNIIHKISSNLKQYWKGYIVIWVEELWNVIRGDEDRITVFLNAMDSRHLNENVMWLLTTNFPENIPENIIDRPSRLDRLVEVNPSGYKPDMMKEWYKFLFDQELDTGELSEDAMKHISTWTIAYLKEFFMNVYMQKKTLAQSYNDIMARKKLIKDKFKTNSGGMGFLSNR